MSASGRPTRGDVPTIRGRRPLAQLVAHRRQAQHCNLDKIQQQFLWWTTFGCIKKWNPASQKIRVFITIYNGLLRVFITDITGLFLTDFVDSGPRPKKRHEPLIFGGNLENRADFLRILRDIKGITEIAITKYYGIVRSVIYLPPWLMMFQFLILYI